MRKILGVGLATFFFGFGAGALYNLYLIYTNSPVVSTLRTSLTFKSSIFGDGILLPLINMLAVAFLLGHKSYLTKVVKRLALLGGVVITAYFHITQAAKGLVNWAMPTPWHWNFLGLWHAIYMFSVSSFLAFFYIIAVRVAGKEKRVPIQLVVVTVGLLIFFILLDLDYS